MEPSTRVALTSFALTLYGGTVDSASARVDAAVAEVGAPVTEDTALAVMRHLTNRAPAMT